MVYNKVGFSLAVLGVAALGSAQSLVSSYNFDGTLDKFYDRDGFATSLQRRRGGSTNVAATGLTYSTETVGSTTKKVANFGNSPADFFRATPGLAANGGATAAYVNQYSILLDLKLTSAGWASFYNTNATNANDGDAFVNPTNGVGISGDYAGSFARNTWNRVVISVSTPQTGASEMNIYLNGSLANTISLGTGSGAGYEGRWALYARNDASVRTVDILGDNDGDSGAGQISALGFYDKALTASEVAKLGAVGSAVPEPASMIALSLGVAAMLRRKRK